MDIAETTSPYPSDLSGTYSLLSNIYGHEVAFGENQAEDDVLDTIQQMYDDGILHGEGWAARPKATGDVGFLICAEPPAGGLSSAQAEGFEATHSLALRTFMDGEGSGIEMILCFVPAHRIGDVQGLIDAVGSLSSARPQP